MQNFIYPWTGSKPDGGKAQNCAYLANENHWGDRECDFPSYACMCLHKRETYLTLRGLCPTSTIDVFYKPMNTHRDIREMKLQGLVHTSIEYVTHETFNWLTGTGTEDMWVLKVIGSNVTAISKAPSTSYSLGKHNWTIFMDKGCSSEKTYTTELKMSGCTEGNFTCDDGQCVRMDLRCNQLSDCRDKSDEKNCRILILEDGYNKEVPPVSSNDPVNVSISIDLLRLVDINEEDYSIEIKFEISLEWKENRARYQNLKKTVALNALAQSDIQKLWLPEVIYENTDNEESTRIGEFGAGEWKTKVVVRREEENGVMSGLESVDEIEMFNGSLNSLVMNQTYTHTFQCNYELSHYPFDTQVFSSVAH